MKTKTIRSLICVLLAAVVGVSSAWAAKAEKKDKRKAKAKAEVESPLSEAGQELEKSYAEQIKTLKEDIQKALPSVNEQKKDAYLKACENEKAADANVNVAEDNFGRIKKAIGGVAHAKGKWIGGADKGIAAAKEELQNATTDAERKAAQAELAKWQDNREAGIKALKQREEVLKEAKAEEPKLIKELEAAKEALAAAKAKALNAFKDLGLEAFLASDALDAKLAKYTVLTEATPRGLAEFAQQGEEQKTLVEALLADDALMIQMAVADGAKRERRSRKLGPGPAKYGQAMKIYTDIQKASSRAKEGVLQRLALATALEHSIPVEQKNPKAQTDGPATIDPVKRYLHYEKAYLDGELDEGFESLDVWDLRMVVDGDDPDETLAWGREMLHNYRPDHITTDDYRWRYVAAVRTEIQYGSQDNIYDKDELQSKQNILMNGGVCGRRAFFGRFILRAFGVPTTKRPQKGHAALTHWTPDGWVVCLGGDWGVGRTVTRYQKDLDFLANTQARENRKAYLQVKRAQWAGAAIGEEPVYGFYSDSGDPAFWHGVSLYKQREIIEEAKAVALAAVGEDIGEANESKVKEEVKAATITEKDKEIVVADNGVITIPAAACSKPTNNTAKIKFMKSNLGGMQLHYGRTEEDEEFEYTFEAPKAGRYALTARVVTPSWKQHLFVAANGAEKPIDIALPHTVGMWDKTDPVEITLAEGKNVLTFSRRHEGLKGLTIRDFTLTPMQ